MSLALTVSSTCRIKPQIHSAGFSVTKNGPWWKANTSSASSLTSKCSSRSSERSTKHRRTLTLTKPTKLQEPLNLLLWAVTRNTSSTFTVIDLALWTTSWRTTLNWTVWSSSRRRSLNPFFLTANTTSSANGESPRHKVDWRVIVIKDTQKVDLLDVEATRYL